MFGSTTQRGTGKAALVAFVVVALVLTGMSLFVGLGTASGRGEADASTIGIGSTRSSLDAAYEFNAAEKLGVVDEALEDAQGQASTAEFTQATERLVSSDVTGPVVALTAVDLGDINTITAAAEIGVLNPPASIGLTALDTSGEGWLVGEASGYDVDSSSTLTRSGRTFDDDCVTVAVPEGMEHLLGHPVVIVYEDMVVVATVTDTGGFAKYGRVLDLGGGVFKAFGYDDIWEWGVRKVYYKFL